MALRRGAVLARHRRNPTAPAGGTGGALARRVVVRTGGRAQLVATAPDRPKRAVEELLELGELVIDVDVALTAQPVGLGVGRVDEPSGFGVGGLHHLVLGHQALLLLDA